MFSANYRGKTGKERRLTRHSHKRLIKPHSSETGGGNRSDRICIDTLGCKEGRAEGGGDAAAAERAEINWGSRTSLSLEEKSFFLPGAHFSGLPAASSQRGNVKRFCAAFYFCQAGNKTASNLLPISCTLNSVTSFLLCDCFYKVPGIEGSRPIFGQV